MNMTATSMELVKHYIKTSKLLADPNIVTASVCGHKWTKEDGLYELLITTFQLLHTEAS